MAWWAEQRRMRLHRWLTLIRDAEYSYTRPYVLASLRGWSFRGPSDVSFLGRGRFPE